MTPEALLGCELELDSSFFGVWFLRPESGDRILEGGPEALSGGGASQSLTDRRPGVGNVKENT